MENEVQKTPYSHLVHIEQQDQKFDRGKVGVSPKKWGRCGRNHAFLVVEGAVENNTIFT
jgi:hypothetical protein